MQCIKCDNDCVDIIELDDSSYDIVLCKCTDCGIDWEVQITNQEELKAREEAYKKSAEDFYRQTGVMI